MIVIRNNPYDSKINGKMALATKKYTRVQQNLFFLHHSSKSSII